MNKRERYTRNRKIVRLRNAGLTITEIARQMGVTRPTVYAVLKATSKGTENANG